MSGNRSRQVARIIALEKTVAQLTKERDAAKFKLAHLWDDFVPHFDYCSEDFVRASGRVDYKAMALHFARLAKYAKLHYLDARRLFLEQRAAISAATNLAQEQFRLRLELEQQLNDNQDEGADT